MGRTCSKKTLSTFQGLLTIPIIFSPQLLATVKKLLCVCSDFAHYMDNLTDTVEDFVEDIKRYDLQFNSVLASLLDRISQLGRDNYNEKVLNILHRSDDMKMS